MRLTLNCMKSAQMCFIFDLPKKIMSSSEGFGERSHQVSIKYEGIYSCLESAFRKFYGLPSTESSKNRSPLETYRELKFVAPAIWYYAIFEKTKYDRFITKSDMVTSVKNWHLEHAKVYIINGEEMILTLFQFDEIVKHTLATLLHRLNHNIDLIVDLGGGWGHRLFDLFLLGVKSKEYVLLERSIAGRRCSNLVYSLFSNLFKFSCHHFDWNHLEDMPVFEGHQNVILFSTHSIEQVPELENKTFDILIDKFPDTENLYGVHLEPVTFQIPVEKSNNPLRYKRDIKYAMDHKYNLDFYNKLSRTKNIFIRHVSPGVFDSCHGNSTSVLIWEFRR